jgi:hypothetical protein
VGGGGGVRRGRMRNDPNIVCTYELKKRKKKERTDFILSQKEKTPYFITHSRYYKIQIKNFSCL